MRRSDLIVAVLLGLALAAGAYLAVTGGGTGPCVDSACSSGAR